MTQYEFFMLMAALISPATTIIGGIFLIHRSYMRLQSTVATLLTKMDELNPQVGQIADLAKVYAELALKVAAVQRDIELIKSDLSVIREHQQLAADNRPEKGKLDALKTKSE